MAEDLGGWQYLDQSLKEIQVCSIPITQDEAIEYAAKVKDFYKIQPHFIGRRHPNTAKYVLIGYKFDPRVGKFVTMEEALT